MHKKLTYLQFFTDLELDLAVVFLAPEVFFVLAIFLISFLFFFWDILVVVWEKASDIIRTLYILSILPYCLAQRR